jgi:SAM-dependent methyltransferase
MTISEHVALLNLLDTIDVSADRVESIRALAATLLSITSYKVQVGTFSQRLESDFMTIRAGIDQFTETINELKQEIRQQIIQHESTYLQNSIRLYQSEMIYETAEYILNRQLTISNEDREWLQGRLRSLGDWRYPALCIRPGLEDYIKIMVPLDPLYIVDQSLRLLEPAVADFDPQYQRRLRQYTVDDYQSAPLLSQLPDNQFAVVFAYNFFNYKPLHVIEQYLREIFVKLRPGGTVIISYNNCDRAHGVALAERSFMTYTPLRLLRPIIDNIGYVNVRNRVCDGDADILELDRPGELSTIRGGQTMAKIVADC